MKKIWIVLLSLGLIAAFSMPAAAVTPEMTGQYYVRGNYLSNPSMLDQDGGSNRSSLSYMDQRLRTFIRLKIADGLTLTSRMDSMEVIWGQNLKNTIPGDSGKTNQQSVAWEQVYVSFATGIGKFDVGYKSGTPYGWGTKFQNAPGTAPGIKWSNTFGNLSVLADFNKTSQGDLDTASDPQLFQTDANNEYYDLGATYKFKGGDAGLLYTFFRNAITRSSSTPTTGAVVTNHVLQPYVRAKFGPVNVEAEAYYMNGKSSPDDPATVDTDYKAQGLYVNGKYTIGPAYIGAKFIYCSGDDPATPNEKEGSLNNTFKYATDTEIWGSISPAILFGYGYHGMGVSSIDSTKGNLSSDLGNTMDNVWMYSIYGGVDVTKKLALSAKAFYAKADEKLATNSVDTDYGTELDLMATYKIYDQLTYNVGFAYLWTGDYFKGTSSSVEVKNVYFVSHWIDLNF
ncbi:MAG: hypothetical protein HY742_10645 [Deltaproteobacteria bacterium]|nr:hypothetical protein [Deltaproteobacteria bacterium]